MPGLLVQALGIYMAPRSAERPEQTFFAMCIRPSLRHLGEILFFEISDTLELVWLWSRRQINLAHLWTLRQRNGRGDANQ